jgi:hypothetical protein
MALGYRSPLRPIPIDTIPVPSVFFGSDQTVSHGGPTVNNLDLQFGNTDEESVLHYNDENTTNSCTKDPWWFEAIRVADDIENKKNTVEFSYMVSIFMMLIHITIFVFTFGLH